MSQCSQLLQRWPGRVSPALNCHASFTGDKCSKLFLGLLVAAEDFFEEETNSLIQTEQRLKDAWVFLMGANKCT